MFDNVVFECVQPLKKTLIPNLTQEELHELEIACDCYKATKLIVNIHFHQTNCPSRRFTPKIILAESTRNMM
jgi:hypothetical protein